MKLTVYDESQRPQIEYCTWQRLIRCDKLQNIIFYLNSLYGTLG